MSNSVRPPRWQPTRLPRPWDSPGKNTGVGCHFLLQCMKVKSESEVAQSCPTLPGPMDCSLPGSSAHGIFQARVLEWVAIAFSATCMLLMPKSACSHTSLPPSPLILVSSLSLGSLQKSLHQIWSLLKLMSIESVMPSNHIILCHPLLLPPSIFPCIRVFSNE